MKLILATLTLGLLSSAAMATDTTCNPIKANYENAGRIDCVVIDTDRGARAAQPYVPMKVVVTPPPPPPPPPPPHDGEGDDGEGDKL